MKKIKKVALFSLLTILSQSLLWAIPPVPPLGFRWVLQEEFSDEFNGDKLDRQKWNDYFPGWQGRPPARFEPKAVSVGDGMMIIENGVLDKPTGDYSIYGGAVTSKSKNAHFGYYECNFKASKIGMSTTFWMSNGKENVASTDCPNDKYSQELDIQECVGGNAAYQKMDVGMNCNTHFRYIKCGERKETFISKGTGTILSTPVAEEFHTYGAWWKNPEEVYFYADNNFFSSVKPSKEILDQPFDRPMAINMVTETYDWQPAPSEQELKNKEINTSYYNWIRSYKLVPINENYDQAKTPSGIYQNTFEVTKMPKSIFKGESISFDYVFSNNAESSIKVKIFEKEGKKQIFKQENHINAYQGYGAGSATIDLNFKPESGKSYELVIVFEDKKSGDDFQKLVVDISE